jgi:hypothetical protein
MGTMWQTVPPLRPWPPGKWVSPPPARQQLRFGESGDPATNQAPSEPTVQEPQPAKETLFRQTIRVLKTFKRKVTHYDEFKRSVRAGCQEGRDSLRQDLRSGSVLRISKRLGMESLGITVAILFIPLPGINPGLFISPTARSFFKGFMSEPPTPSEKPPTTSADPEKTPEADDPKVPRETSG